MAGPYPWQLVDVPYDGRTAAVRYNNPGAQYPSSAAAKYGMEGFGVIGGGHKIAKFPTEAHGAAANMDNFARNYRGMRLGDAVAKWRGGNGSVNVPEGFDPNAIVDDSFIGDRERMTQFFDKMARHEGRGSAGPVNPETWRQGYDLFRGGPQEPQGSPVTPVSQSPVRTASAQGNDAMLPMLATLLGMAVPGMGTAAAAGSTMAGGGSAGAGMGGSPMGGGTPFSMGGGGGGAPSGPQGDSAGAQAAMKTAAGQPDQSMFAGPAQAQRPVDLQQLMASLAKRQKLGLGG